MILNNGTIKDGLSFVVCCYNSADRIRKTLLCLATQNFDMVPAWEILLVDNASTDSTVDTSVQFWAQLSHDPSRLRIVKEDRLGIAYARYKGIKEASYAYICFIDDDNWVDQSYAQTAFSFMLSHPNVAVCGSLNEVAADGPLPDWFCDFQRSYAVGPQSEEAGDITQNRGVLWSAGMVLRKSAVLGLLSAGFEPMVTGAQGDSRLLRSEDYELCLALRLCGWRLWYLPGLKLKHQMPANRLTWHYLRRLLKGVGMSDPGLYPYYAFAELTCRSSSLVWLKFILINLLQIVKRPIVFLLHPFVLYEGNRDVLAIVRSIGCLQVLVCEWRSFLKSLNKISSATWIAGKGD